MSNNDTSEPTGEETPQIKLGQGGYFDQDIYGGSKSKFAGYVTSIAPNEQVSQIAYSTCVL